VSVSPLVALAWRESRFARRRLLLFLSSIALGVAALVATQSFSANLAGGVRDESKAVVGADLALSATRPFGERTEALLDSLVRAGAPVSRVTSFASMALAERTDAARLAQVRAVEPGFPYYGEVVTAPAGRWETLGNGRSALADPALLTALDARVGDTIRLGEARFEVVGTVERMPGSVGVQSLFAPRIFIPAAHLEATRLVGFGSRIEYEAFARLADAEAARIGRDHRETFRVDRVQARTATERQAALETALGRLGRFLGLIGTFALLLGGIGVASAMGAYMAAKRETVATLRCLGATAPQVLAVYLLQALAMGLLGAAAGTAIGLSVQWVLPRLLEDLLPVAVRTTPSLPAVLTGIAVGVWTAVAFALLPLLATRRISPLQAIRRRVEPEAVAGLDAWTLAGWTLLGASVVGLILLQAGDLRTGALFASGAGVTLLLLWGIAWVVVRAARAGRWTSLPYPARQGLANLHRPGNQTRVVVLALGFGVFLLGVVYLVQGNLLRPLRADPAAQGNVLLFDVQPEQREGVRAILAAEATRVLQEAPIVPMRIAAIGGVPAARLLQGAGEDAGAEDAAEPDGAAEPASDGAPTEGGGDGAATARGAGRGAGPGPEGWAVRREYRSTWRDTLVASETLLRGRMWAPGGGEGEVSLESGVASDLGVDVGDRIAWDVQGVRIETRVTSLRTVDWQRLEPNFFAIFPERVLSVAPHTVVMLARAPTPAARALAQRDVARRYPNVAVLDLTAIQAAVDAVLGRVAAVIRFLAGFSVATGFVVLLGAILTGRLQRIREAVLLRTLGASRRQIAGILLWEYLALGVLAGLAGALLAVGAGWLLARFVFEVPFVVPVLRLAALAASVAALSALVGVAASREVFRSTPLEALREE
jgi:putative ABC transport system permease protein